MRWVFAAAMLATWVFVAFWSMETAAHEETQCVGPAMEPACVERVYHLWNLKRVECDRNQRIDFLVLDGSKLAVCRCREFENE